jgi:phosphatidylinositol alpha-mannosyltransferase
MSTTPLTIGFVLDDSLDTTDGVQQYVLTLGKWLSEQGHSVHYLVGQTVRRDIPNVHSLTRNVSVRFNGNRMSVPLPASRRAIRALLAREQFDILHVQMPYSPFLAGRVMKAASKTTAVVGTFHVAPHSGLVHVANQALRQLVRGSIARFDDVVSVSTVAQAFAKDTFQLPSTVLPNTVALKPFYEAKPFPQYKKVRTIVFLGRLVERKGCAHLLAAVASLHAAGRQNDVRVVICGRGPLEASLKQYVRGHGLQKIVEFTGFITEEDKPRYLASADIVTFPSTGGESFGIVLLEAMAASRGVVLAGDNPGYAAVMQQRPQALFDPHDEQAFAVLLARMLDDDAARAQARTWQQQYVRQFDVPQVGAQVLRRYTSALHKRRA